MSATVGQADHAATPNDTRFEFDAPKFYDFGGGSPEDSRPDGWFDTAGPAGLRTPPEADENADHENQLPEPPKVTPLKVRTTDEAPRSPDASPRATVAKEGAACERPTLAPIVNTRAPGTDGGPARQTVRTLELGDAQAKAETSKGTEATEVPGGGSKTPRGRAGTPGPAPELPARVTRSACKRGVPATRVRRHLEAPVQAGPEALPEGVAIRADASPGKRAPGSAAPEEKRAPGSAASARKATPGAAAPAGGVKPGLASEGPARGSRRTTSAPKAASKASLTAPKASSTTAKTSSAAPKARFAIPEASSAALNPKVDVPKREAPETEPSGAKPAGKRPRIHGMRTRSAAPVPVEPPPSPWRSLAEQVAEFEGREPWAAAHAARHRRSAAAEASGSDGSHLTRPKTPAFATKARSRPARFKPTDEAEAEAIAALPKFRARPFDPSLFTGEARGVKAKAKQPTTAPEPFTLRTDRRGTARGGSGQPPR